MTTKFHSNWFLIFDLSWNCPIFFQWAENGNECFFMNPKNHNTYLFENLDYITDRQRQLVRFVLPVAVNDFTSSVLGGSFVPTRSIKKNNEKVKVWINNDPSEVPGTTLSLTSARPGSCRRARARGQSCPETYRSGRLPSVCPPTSRPAGSWCWLWWHLSSASARLLPSRRSRTRRWRSLERERERKRKRKKVEVRTFM